ncbi:MAG: glucose-1-phosphate thymidylyltransferase RfbA [Bacillota bacterium]|jgi:glucose-1-phosphate thymidylyltransferase
MKGIILAAGRGTRLYPMTKTVCKPLLPVYDKPLIYYSIEVFLLAEIKDILIIVPPGEIPQFAALLGNGIDFGVRISYKEQPVPRGIADAFIIGEDFIGGDSVCLMLGDNIFYAENLEQKLLLGKKKQKGAAVFGYYVDDPRPFGVVEFDEKGNAVSIEEKPQNPKSNYIIPGLYFYDSSVIDIAKDLKPSKRGELEITDVNFAYLNQGQLQVITLSDDTLWLDAGNADALLESSVKIAELQRQTGKLIGCPEATAYKKHYIDSKQLREIGEKLKMTVYGRYLLSL